MLPARRLAIEAALGLRPAVAGGVPREPGSPSPTRGEEERRPSPPVVPPPTERSWRLGSSVWCPFPRRRWFFATLPSGRGIAARPPTRPSPWEPGWRPLGAVVGAMLRSRGPREATEFRASKYRYAPRYL
eukprot:4318608-Alexandrium_andersonii.AAC.1